MERLPKLVQTSDYCPLLLFHVGPSSTAKGDLENLKREYMTPEAEVKGIEVQVVFFSVVLVRA